MSINKEAKARITINNLLEKAGWRFFDLENSQANISLETNVKLFSETLKTSDRELLK